MREGDVVAVDGNDGILVLGAVKLVPAQPGPNLARLLTWCDERLKIPIVNDVPEGYTVVRSPEEATGCGAAPVVVDVEWEGASSSVLLDKTVTAALEAGCDALALRIPDTLAGADMRPPDAPWTHLVVSEGKEWCARLLAARISPAPARATVPRTTPASRRPPTRAAARARRAPAAWRRACSAARRGTARTRPRRSSPA